MTNMFLEGASTYLGEGELSMQFLYSQNLRKTFTFTGFEFAKETSLNQFQVQKGSFHLNLGL